MAMAPRQGVAGREVVDDESKWLWAQTARFRLESVGLDAFVPGSAGWLRRGAQQRVIEHATSMAALEPPIDPVREAEATLKAAPCDRPDEAEAALDAMGSMDAMDAMGAMDSMDAMDAVDFMDAMDSMDAMDGMDSLALGFNIVAEEDREWLLVAGDSKSPAPKAPEAWENESKWLCHGCGANLKIRLYHFDEQSRFWCYTCAPEWPSYLGVRADPAAVAEWVKRETPKWERERELERELLRQSVKPA
jgi:hypothetical protein